MTSAGLLFGKYKLLELIARGGMAEVFKAKSFGADGFEKVVVIKRILPELAQHQSFVDMCIAEAKLSVSLTHANIVQVFDLGREEDTYFIVMEYVQGMDFAEVLRRCRRSGQRAPLELCVYLTSEVARALDYAHRRKDAQLRPLGIVHRDVSPQNILLSFEGEIKVTDFGIAKARTSVEEKGTVKGKYQYMSPEQARGDAVDARADICALGIVLWEALTGHNPFLESTPYETLRRVQQGQKPLLKDVAPQLPDELCRIVEQATATEPSARFASAARFYEALSGFLYTTGHRVSSHDTADWLGTLVETRERSSDGHRVRDALAQPEGEGPHTPVEVPASKGPVARPGPSTTGGFAHPHLERRDVTLLALLAESPAGVAAIEQTLVPLGERHGAVVAERSDDGVVLVFGTAEPDGRDAEAATRCAVRMQSALLRALPGGTVGMGLHATRLHLDGQGTLSRDRWFIEAVNRVRGIAQDSRGRVLACDTVARLVSELFVVRAVDSAQAHTGDASLALLEVLVAVTPHEGAHRRFVGRKEPFRRVGEALARAGRKGPCTIAIVGEVGSGKSRFLAESRYRLARMGHPVAWYQVACLPQDREVPMTAMRSLVQAVLGIDDGPLPPDLDERTARMRTLGLGADELHAVRVLLGLERSSTEEHGSRLLRSALTRMAAGLSRDQLTVFAWDNGDCMDSESRTLLRELAGLHARTRLALLTASRAGAPGPLDGLEGVLTLTLGPLDDNEVAQLVHARLGLARELEVPPELLQDLAVKGTGNPLFLEAYLRTLIEAGAVELGQGQVSYHRNVAEVGVPRTLRGLVARELAALGGPERLVLQCAAVIGTRMSRALLSEVCGLSESAFDTAIEELVKGGSLNEGAGAGDELAFAHEVRREVVYESLPVEARRQLHATVAAALERLEPDRLDELAERLAYHFREAHEWARKIHYLIRAARRQRAAWAYDAATRHFARALELLLVSPQVDAAQILELFAELGEVALLGRQLELGLERMPLGVRFAEQLNDAEATARMLLALGRLYAHNHQTGDAVTSFERAHQMLDRDRDRELVAETLAAMGDAMVRNGEFRAAQGFLEQAADLAHRRGGREAVRSLLALARCEAAAGDASRALATWERANDAAERLDDPPTRIDLGMALAMVYMQCRDYEQAATHFEAMLELAREYGISYQAAVAAHNVGDIRLRLGDHRAAFTAMRASLDVCVEHEFHKLAALNRVYLAFIDALKFGKPEAQQVLEVALTYAEGKGYIWDVLQLKYLMGALAHAQGDQMAARTMLRDALALANETNNVLYREDCEALLRDVTSLPPTSSKPPRPPA